MNPKSKNAPFLAIVIQAATLWLFWIALFFIHRLLFLIFFIKELKGIGFPEIIKVFSYGLSMDFSAAAYLIFLPVTFLCAGLLLKKQNAVLTIINWLNYFLIIFNLIIIFIGIGLYANWGQKINSKAISFLLFPEEVAGIIMNAYNLLYFAIFIIFTAAWIILYRKFFRPRFILRSGFLRTGIFYLLITALLFITVRGGFQKYPLSKSNCYYSKHSVLNFAALNDFWNFFDIIVNPVIKDNPYVFYDDTTAEKIIEDLYCCPDSVEKITDKEKPNVVLIILESFSADAVSCLGGEPGIAPMFDSLSAEGLLFTNYFATGFRTDQGLIALLNGFPAQPVSSIIKNFGKFDRLPSLYKTLSENNYYTSYYFGGNLEFANTLTYLKVNGTNRIIGINEIPHSRETDWGAYDEDLFGFHIKDIITSKEPFFSVILSLTNHENFTADVDKVFKGNSVIDSYKNTTHYTDKCLYDYIQSAKKQAWYDNTLFFIVADHAHRYPLDRNYNEPLRHHIPFLILGGALKEEYRGSKITKTCSQIDFPATVLSQLNISYKEFIWSKDNLNKGSKGFALYTFDNGFGFLTDSSRCVYDHNLKTTLIYEDIIAGSQKEKSLTQGKALLQKAFQQYIDL